MATATSTDPMKQVPLSDEEVEQRSKKLVEIIGEKDKLEAQKSLQNTKWNEQIRWYDEQVSKIARECRERKAWIPAQLTGGNGMGVAPDDDEAVNAGDSVDELSQRRAKKAAKKPGKKRPPRTPS